MYDWMNFRLVLKRIFRVLQCRRIGVHEIENDILNGFHIIGLSVVETKLF